jgi:hypothetical protein
MMMGVRGRETRAQRNGVTRAQQWETIAQQ